MLSNRRYLLTAISLASALASVAFAEGAGIHIATVTPAIRDGTLLVDVECEELFSPRSLSTLQSGLPAVLQLELQLLRGTRVRTMLGLGQEEFDIVHTVREAHSIRYDLWGERYTIHQRGRDMQIAASVEDAEAAAAVYSGLVLGPLAQWHVDVTYRTRARVQLLPISPEQGDRIADWLRAPAPLSNAADEEDGGSFGFDVSELLSVLWGRGKPTRDRSQWYEGDSFRLDAAGKLQP